VGDGGACDLIGVPGSGVNAHMIATILGGNPNNPIDVLFDVPAPAVVMNSLGSTWLHDHIVPPPWSGGPAAGCGPGVPGHPRNFKVVDVPHTGPHPVQPQDDFPLPEGVPALSAWAIPLMILCILSAAKLTLSWRRRTT